MSRARPGRQEATTGKRIARAVALGALAGFAAALWVVGPMVGFGGARPLASPWLRGALIAAVLLLVAVAAGWRFLRRRRTEKRLAAAIAATEGDKDPEKLELRMNEALAAFKERSGRRTALRSLPWYVLLGPKGAGKTTALLRSDLTLPPSSPPLAPLSAPPSAAAGGGPPPTHGVGATEYCDWWFAGEAVLVDTAGRYTMHRPDSTADRRNWLAFLALLRGSRPKQPVNGVIVMFSLEDLMLLDDAGLGAHLATIRARLDEIGAGAGIAVPVYVMFTKADLIDGFCEFFSRLDADEKRQAWGATLPLEETGNVAAQVVAEFDALAARLAAAAAGRLGVEPDVAARRLIFAFPQQFDRLRSRVERFLRAVAQPAGATGASAVLRGFYFSSAAREGVPVDMLGAVPRRTGGAGRPPAPEGFFLRDFLPKVVLPEARWVVRRSSPARRAAALRRAGYAATALLAVAGLGAWSVSFAANRALIRATGEVIEENRAAAEKVLGAGTVADADLETVTGVLEMLRDLPAGFAGGEAPAPVWEGFGLGQRERLRSAAETAYRQALERQFRTRLLLRLEQVIGSGLRDPAAIYEPLKIYLNLGGKAPRSDDALVVSWFRNDWERNRYPGAVNREGRAQLEKHLQAMLALDDGQVPAAALDGKLVEAAQRSLSRLELADLASALINSAVPAAGMADLTAGSLAGGKAPDVFDTTDGSDLGLLKVPGLYSQAGFNKFLLPHLAKLGDKLADDQWVLGAGGEQVALQANLDALGPRLMDRYGQDFLASWNKFLGRLKARPLAAQGPSYPALAAAASPDSPFRMLIEGVAEQTGLTEGTGAAEHADADAMDEGLRRIGLSLYAGKGQNRAGGGGSGASGIPGESIAAQFRPYRLLVDGAEGQRPVDVLVRNFSDILQSLVLAANSSGQAERVNANLQLQIANLRANASRFPRPILRMIQAAAVDFEGSAAETSVAELKRMLDSEVTQPCKATLAGTYPFDHAGERDLAIDDFARLFAPNGPLDSFFARNLLQFADIEGSEWQWRQDTPLGRALPAATLKSFQQAARIRDGFFPKGSAQPSVAVTLKPQSLHGDVDMALLEIGGQIVQSYQAGSVPATITWPETVASGPITLSLTPEIPGRPSSAAFSGPWALMRLLDTGAVSTSGNAVQARVVIGGRDVTYALQTSSAVNPFVPPGLSGFTCPSGL